MTLENIKSNLRSVTETYYQGIIDATYRTQTQLNALLGVEGNIKAIADFIKSTNAERDKVLALVEAMSDDSILDTYNPEMINDTDKAATIPDTLGLTDEQNLALASAVAVISEAEI